MNVLESLHMVSRSAKNRYSWHGRTKLGETLAILKHVGEKHRYGQQMQQIRQRIRDREFDFNSEEKENEAEFGEQKELFFVEHPGVEPKETPESTGTEGDTATKRLQPTAPGPMEPPKVPLLTPTQESGVHQTLRTPLAGQPAGSVTFIPAQCSRLIPVLIPQQQGNAPYAVYLHSSTLRSNPLSRPQPTSLAVRSMTFEDKTGQSPNARSASKSQPVSRESDISPLKLKRQRSDSTSETSPSKTKKSEPNFKDSCPKLSEILHARLKARCGSRPSPRALHLDPEFINTPGSAAGNQTLEHSLENLLDRDDKSANSDSEADFTPVHAVPFTPGQIHSEVNAPTPCSTCFREEQD
ncbi:hypothetical protein XENOCAPTIV_029330 [Xenoophorus captivus]|uniref:Uncharacterized protein n=1 Tax=Xenoophorus captivus TaxID=1517983 RepID=A0ABV0Q6P8_9TELE